MRAIEPLKLTGFCKADFYPSLYWRINKETQLANSKSEQNPTKDPAMEVSGF